MDPFSFLPKEILCEIIKLVPDLHSLRCVIDASPTVSHLFDEMGAEITEAVMSQSIPPQIVVLMRMVVMIDSDSALAGTLDEFINTYVLSAYRASPWCAPLTLTLPRTSVLRRILALHCQIRHLTNCCLHELIRRCMDSKPSRLLDHRFVYRKNHFSGKIPHSLPLGQPYQPQDGGPPSWVEEQRVCRAFWYLQLFFDLKDAATKGRLVWPQQDVLHLQNFTVTKFWKPLRASQNDQIETVLEYVQDYNSSITHNSSSSQPLDKLPYTIGELQIHWLTLQPADTYWFGQSEDYLDITSPGFDYGRGALTVTPGSPLQYVDFGIFRRLGFAVWDLKRMIAFEFMSPVPPPGQFEYDTGDRNPDTPNYLSRHELMFTWQSLLTEEQLVEHERVRLANLR